MNGKIIIVTHKDYAMPKDDIYLPISVGAEAGLIQHFQADNTGINISSKNKTYCELTAIYWAWKNLDLDSFDYIGVAHYRRHFTNHIHANHIDQAVSGKILEDIFSEEPPGTVLVTPKRTYISSLQNHYIQSSKGYVEIHRKDIQRLRNAIHMCSPEYDASADRVLKGHSAHMLNMFIMRSEDFGAYCKWLFPVIDTVVSMSGDREDQRRYAGALSEFCLDIWLTQRRYPVKEMKLLETEKPSFFKKALNAIKRRFL